MLYVVLDDKIVKLAQNNPDTLFVIDEAFHDFIEVCPAFF